MCYHCGTPMRLSTATDLALLSDRETDRKNDRNKEKKTERKNERGVVKYVFFFCCGIPVCLDESTTTPTATDPAGPTPSRGVVAVAQ